ncbi:glycosyltransferase family 2 protein [Flavobacterium sp.]|uniref:glycosyltransferase family 2 protein n=1 Tax=Flavobacterium sp. TaxID=239 RepID=UPI003F69569E
MKISVFTPTYNRANLLINVYESLLNQSYQNFEWIVVDDGSNDNTNSVIESYIKENKIKINYFLQKNKGKHFAINKGVSIANGELFFILDSDDELPMNALELVSIKYDKIRNNSKIGGIAGRRNYKDGSIVGNKTFEELISNSIDIRYKYNIKGDLVEVFKTAILKENLFPEILNEKFCPEALVWNRIAQKYDLYFFNQGIYTTQYLPDGLTSKIVKIRMTSPIASMLTYSELASYNIPLHQKVRATINFWRFSFNSNLDFIKKIKMINVLYSILCFPLGLFLFIKDKIQQK